MWSHWILAFTALLALLQHSFSASKKCINGIIQAGRCECHFGYTGAYCHRLMHCDSFARHENGSCRDCLPNWSGRDCDVIECGENGIPNKDLLECICETPYIGIHCNNFTRNSIYDHYNKKNIYSTPVSPILGALLILPLCFTVWACNHASKRNRHRKVEAHLEKVIGRDLKSDTVHALLYEKEPKKSSGKK